jgi:hypothetical protein
MGALGVNEVVEIMEYAGLSGSGRYKSFVLFRGSYGYQSNQTIHEITRNLRSEADHRERLRSTSVREIYFFFEADFFFGTLPPGHFFPGTTLKRSLLPFVHCLLNFF